MKTLNKKNIEDILALTPMQEGMLFHYLRSPDRGVYFEQLSLEISGEIDTQLFENAWNFVIETNEMLRAVFRWEDVENPVQIILNEHQIQSRYYDFASMEVSKKKLFVEEIKTSDREEKFDLRKVPFRVTLCKIEEKKYELIISYHHILYDGWSNGIILKEFINAYDDLSKGRKLIKPLKNKFREFVKWILQQGIDIDREKNFWEDYLKGFDTQTELPLKQKRNGKEIWGTAKYQIKFKKEVKNIIDNFVKNYKITLASLLYSAWGILLQRYNNAEDVVFGTTVSGRSAKLKGIEEIVGLFIHTLPLRIHAHADEKIEGFLSRIDNTLQMRRVYEAIPLMEINEVSELDSSEEFFDHIVIIENYPLNTTLMFNKSGLVVESYSMVEMTHYDLVVEIMLFDNITVNLIYREDTLAKDSVERLSEHFSRVLKDIVNNPGKKISELEILSEEEKKKLLYKFNNTEIDYPSDKPIHQLFAEQVGRTPEKIAVVGCGQLASGKKEKMHITYGISNEKAAQMAHILTGKGVTPDTIVGIMIRRSIELMVGILGILKAGASFLPINPEYPLERINYMLRDSNVKVLLSEPAAQAKVETEIKEKEPSIEIIDIFKSLSSPPLTLTSTSNKVCSANLAYVIYTSGSTGKPRGVMIGHRSLVNYCWWAARVYVKGVALDFPLYTSISFDLTITSIFIPLLTGNKIFVYGGKDNAFLIERIIDDNKTGGIKLTPSHLRLLKYREGDISGSNVKCFIVGGEKLERELALDIHKKFSGDIEIYNEYGPTEATVGCMIYRFEPDYIGSESVPIGLPANNTRLYVLDNYFRPLPFGVAGELFIEGDGLARGYLNRPELTAEKFDQDFWDYPDYQDEKNYKKFCGGPGGGFLKEPPGRRGLYKTGDWVRRLQDGNIEFLGRMDHQVKIRGFRIELREIENWLMKLGWIKEAIVIDREGESGEKYLCAYIIPVKEALCAHSEPNESDPCGGHTLPNASELRLYLSRTLPDYMIPSHFVQLEKIPLTSSGKVDRRALLSLGTKLSSGVKYASPESYLEKAIAAIWKELLNLDRVGIHDNFFDIGGNSLSIIRLSSRLGKVLKREIPVVTLFNYPTIAAQAGHLSREGVGDRKAGRVRKEVIDKRRKWVQRRGREIAVIGMACRFPGARNISQFWENVKNGVDSVTYLKEKELREKGVSEELINNPDYVPAKGFLEDKECFDSSFFGYTPEETRFMEPQLRIFHECCWEALENAGYDPETYEGRIGLFAGASANPFWTVLPLKSGISGHSYFEKWNAIQFSDKDYLATRIGYKLDLKGPCVSVQTACSTSLVAVDLACQALLSDKCDMVMAGGISITLHDETGYLYHEGFVMSPYGHCRAFDASCKGIVNGNGAGVVVLKPLEHALVDSDHIYAVIRSTAVNNDGKKKVGFTAPSSEGQAKAIRLAMEIADIKPESISYLEAHGTGTPLGDPIEVEGLKKAFNIGSSNNKKYCALGSVKTNFGHLDAAAGIAGFIKTSLALKHRLIPPILHFETPNPALDIENSPFYINTVLKVWENDSYPLRAGVSSFGLGGTNAHVILEEVQVDRIRIRETGDSKHQLILLSARTETGLERMIENLANHFRENPGISLADAAYTLQIGRRKFPHRGMSVSSTLEQAITALDSGALETGFSRDERPTIVFMFPGQGSEYLNMGLDLYKNEPVFRHHMDNGFELMEKIKGIKIKPVLYPDEGKTKEAEDKLYDFNYTSPIKFIFEYSLVKFLMNWGIKPDAMIGHSFGEYTAACLSGVFSFEEGLYLAALRGELVEKAPEGAMLSVSLPEKEVRLLLTHRLSLAAINAESICVAAGPVEEIERFERDLDKKGIECLRFRVSKAGHSPMMDPILDEFKRRIRKVVFKNPRLPYISGLTGKWITAEEAADPEYWAQHLCQTIRFNDGLNTLFKEPNPIFLQVGPGRGLILFVNQHEDKIPGIPAVSMVRHKKEEISDVYYTLKKIGQLWLHGLDIDWKTFYSGEERQRIPLPTYPFEKKHYPIDENLFATDINGVPATSKTAIDSGIQKKTDISEWFYIPSWERMMLPPGPADNPPQKQESFYALIFTDRYGLGRQLKGRLEQEHPELTPITVEMGTTFKEVDDWTYTLHPSEKESYYDLISELERQKRIPRQVYHLWGIGRGDSKKPIKEQIDETLVSGFYSLLFLVQALVNPQVHTSQEIRIEVVTDNAHEVTGEEESHPDKAAVYGLCMVISQEHPNIFCQCIDISLPACRLGSEPNVGEVGMERQVEQLTAEFFSGSQDRLVAYRDIFRWIQSFKPLRLEKQPGVLPLKERGVYWITGGIGAIGLVLARHLAKTLKAKLILTGRSIFPPREDWDRWLLTHPENHGVSLRIRKLREIEEMGGEVLLLSADAADPQQMQAVVRQAEEKFGTIHGVIHSAGLVGDKSFSTIKEMDKTHAQLHFQSKIYGLLVLEEILKNKPIDFCLLMSSNASILGGLGFGAYSAANIFLDAYAQYLNRSMPTRWISINWDGWQLDEKQVKDTLLGSMIKKLAMTPGEGAEVFERILSWKEAVQVIQCTGDLQPRLDQWVKLDSLKQADNVELEQENEAVQGKERTLYQPRPQLGNPYSAPVNPQQEELAGIWKNLLGCEPVGIRDNFFELGGDSLKAVIAISKIHKALNVKIPVKDFFTTPTIEELSRYINQTGKSLYIPLEPLETKEYYPLSSAQKRMFILNQLEKEKGSTAYNIPAVMELEGVLVRNRFEQIIRQIIRRHESLRTSFHILTDGPIQKIREDVEFEIEYHDPVDNKQWTESPGIIAAFIRPFDLSRAPLLRVGLIPISEQRGNPGERNILMLDMHHIISDGMSLVVMAQDFTRLYTGKEIPEMKLQYKDFAQWQNLDKKSEKAVEQGKYWIKRFEGEIPVLNFPTDNEKWENRNFEGGVVTRVMGDEDSRELKRLAMEQGVTLYMILLAIFDILLAKRVGQEDIVVGAPVAGRRHADLEPIVGMFVNTIALRNRPDGEKTFLNLLKEVKESTIAAFENQDYPFEDLVEKVVAERNTKRNPIFDVMFDFQIVESGVGRIFEEIAGGLKIKLYKHENGTSKFDFGLSTYQVGGRIYLYMEYCKSLYKKETMETLLAHYEKIAGAVTADKEVKINNIQLIEEHEGNEIRLKIQKDIEAIEVHQDIEFDI